MNLKLFAGTPSFDFLQTPFMNVKNKVLNHSIQPNAVFLSVNIVAIPVINHLSDHLSDHLSAHLSAIVSTFTTKNFSKTINFAVFTFFVYRVNNLVVSQLLKKDYSSFVFITSFLLGIIRLLQQQINAHTSSIDDQYVKIQLNATHNENIVRISKDAVGEFQKELNLLKTEFQSKFEEVYSQLDNVKEEIKTQIASSKDFETNIRTLNKHIKTLDEKLTEMKNKIILQDQLDNLYKEFNELKIKTEDCVATIKSSKIKNKNKNDDDNITSFNNSSTKNSHINKKNKNKKNK